MYSIKQIIKALMYLKSNQLLSVNEDYNITTLGFSTSCYKAVDKAMNSLYGMRCNWPIAVKTKELVNEVNKTKY